MNFFLYIRSLHLLETIRLTESSFNRNYSFIRNYHLTESSFIKDYYFLKFNLNIFYFYLFIKIISIIFVA